MGTIAYSITASASAALSCSRRRISTLYFSSGNWLWSYDTWTAATASWNTAFRPLARLLFYLRGRQRSAKRLVVGIPVAFALAALAWVVPQYWSLSLVYIHPFVAMWFLERQIRRTRPEWLRAYHWCLASIPFFLAVIMAELCVAAQTCPRTRISFGG